MKRIVSGFLKLTAWADYLLLILSVFTCTFFIYKDFGLRMLYGYAFCSAILLIHLIRRILLKRPPQVSAVKLMYAAEVFVVFICFLRPDSRHDTDMVSYILSMLICSAMVLLSDPSKRELNVCVCIFAIFALLLSLYTILFALFPDFYWNTIYPHLSIDTRQMAVYYVPRGYSIPVGGSYTFVDYVVMMVLPVTLIVFIVPFRKKWLSVLSIFSFFLLFATIFIIGRRGEMLSALGAIFIVYILSINYNEKKQLAQRAASGIVLFVFFTGMLAVLTIHGYAPRYQKTAEQVYTIFKTELEISQPPDTSPNENVVIPMEEAAVENIDISSGRFELWAIAWDLFKSHPILGVGWGGFADYVSDEFSEIHARGSGQQDVVNVHNSYLQFLCETGIVGTVFILFPMMYIYFSVMLQLVRLVKNKDPNRDVLKWNLASLGSQTFFLLVNVLDMSFYQYKFWGFYGIGMLLGFAALRTEGYEFHDLIGVFCKRIEANISPDYISSTCSFTESESET